MPDQEITLGQQIEELERCIAHLEGRLVGHEFPRERRVRILHSIVDRLLSKGPME